MDVLAANRPSTPAMDSPRTTDVAASPVLSHDSMVTVRLSEPPALSIVTSSLASELARPISDDDEDEDEEDASSPEYAVASKDQRSSTSSRGTARASSASQHAASKAPAPDIQEPPQPQEATDESSSMDDEEAADDVNWAQLEKTESQEPKDGASDESTALLLARLEQENNMLATNPKSAMSKASKSSRRASRPPSMQHLRKLVNDPAPPALRYSLLPPPPMTDLEFYAAVVQDYKRTAQCLPTLLSKKIRSGVPPPLRGVVWQSMAGARDLALEEQFDHLCGESSPYEGMIGKDIGRSFPGVEMFRDPAGDGQRMLGRVLKCFSLYDQKIGYCQGLGFLVGPLLMHMDDRAAFCVLVRLMENYDLRSCFLPDLSGLHVRIYQFGELLKMQLPELAAHLENLQVEPAYVSQWFLSFFAVTCPLPMLFRIYDVVFAEGASPTIMKVALSLMGKNQARILACTESEDVMQLLLSRGLWDCYHYNADEFVNDFVAFNMVTHETLQSLEASFKDSQEVDVQVTSNIGSAASRFLGRLWAGSKNNLSLSPGLGTSSRPFSFVPRSPSKQSIASTLNSAEGSSDSVLSLASTDATTVSRDSSNADAASTRIESNVYSIPTSAKAVSRDKDLHGQIEDLLRVVSELQRDGALLATQLQKEKEEREEDRNVVKALLDGLRSRIRSETLESSGSEETVVLCEIKEDDDSGSESDALEFASKKTPANDMGDMSQLTSLFDATEERFCKPFERRRSSLLQTKSQLREELARAKEQLIFEVTRGQDLSRKLDEMEHTISSLRDEIKDNRNFLRNSHQDKQRLEKQLQEMRARNSAISEKGIERSASMGRGSGLRELKLGRSNTAPFAKRTSSLHAPEVVEPTRTAEHEAVLLELAQAKTAEAIAKQEAEEARAKLESLRKVIAAKGDGQMVAQAAERNNTLGYFASPPVDKAATPPAAAPPASTGGFWGWGKRAVSTSEKV